MEEAAGVKVLEADSFPHLQAWIQNFKEIPVIKEGLLDRNALLSVDIFHGEKTTLCLCSSIINATS